MEQLIFSITRNEKGILNINVGLGQTTEAEVMKLLKSLSEAQAHLLGVLIKSGQDALIKQLKKTQENNQGETKNDKE